MRPVSLLFTGFEPFGGEAVNPSWAAVERLPERIGRRIHPHAAAARGV